jgi:small subunit ribosomal protein S13
MARVAGIDLPREKRGEVAVTYIYGIGRADGAAGFDGCAG